MKVTIRIHEFAAPQLLAWRRTLASDPSDARALASNYLDELKSRLAAAGGLLQSAVRDGRTDPPTY